jgi:nitronate monooxygenase
MWPDRRLLDLFKIEVPIVQAPMAGAMDTELALAVAEAGALASLPVAMLSEQQLREQMTTFRAATRKPVNVNFFCHTPPVPNNEREHGWREMLRPYYVEYGLDPNASAPSANRRPFDDAHCVVVEELKPEIVSFHFGLPAPALLKRVKAAGCLVMSSATTVEEARWLEAHGCDVVIAQGYDAGGHRGMFLTDNLTTQVGTFSLVPQVVDAVKVPVVAAGGVTDARGIVAALALGASAAQIGTAYNFTPESRIAPLHRAALKAARDDGTVVTNMQTGKPARGFVNRVMRELGPVNKAVPDFPLAGGALAPLNAKAVAQERADFLTMWAGQAASLGREMPARELTAKLASETQALMRRMAG